MFNPLRGIKVLDFTHVLAGPACSYYLGLLGADIKCINRGSIREAKVTIKAYNKFQFELLELVYLRLGYSVMLEWGFDKYIDENQQIQNVGNTLIENDWFKNQVSNIAMYSQIEYYRGIYNFHYDAFYGKVVNFDWDFKLLKH